MWTEHVLLQLAYSIEIWISNVTASNNWAWNGANMFLYGKDCANSSFRIENTVSMHGRGNRGTGLLFQWDSSTDSYLCARERISHQIVSIDSSLFATNTAMQGSAVEVSTHSSSMVSNQISATGYHFVLRNSSIVFNTILIATQHSATFNFTGNGKALFQNVNISHNSYSTSAGFILGTVTPSPKILGVHKSDRRSLSLDCLNCNFSHNTNATVLELINGSISIRFQGTTIFAKNINAMKRSILYLVSVSLQFIGTTKFVENGNSGGIYSTASSLSFEGNTLFRGNKNVFKVQSGGAIDATVYSKLYFISNTSFEENEAEFGGAIAIDTETQIYVQGSMNFQNNRAIYGGAMSIMPKCYIQSISPTQINFFQNTASVYGGGIYAVAGDSSRGAPFCFIQLWQVNLTKDFIQMVFNYNKAGVAGSALFGGYLDQCLSLTIGFYPIRGSELSEYHFHFKANDSDLSVVYSDP